MKKIWVATEKPFAPAAIGQMKAVADKAGFEMVLLEKYTSTNELLEAVADADALIVRSDKVTREVLDAAPRLRVVVRAGAGYDNLDLEACTMHGIVAMNTPGQNSNAVAELVLGMMVFQARNQFDGTPGTELKGKKLGIHAYGNVGAKVARIAKGFGMEVYDYDPYVNNQIIESDGVTPLDSAAELYKTCQYVSLHIPANETTIKSINRELLMSMPPHAVLLNTARKEVINEEDMIKVMKERDDLFYLSDIAPDNKDVFEKQFPGRFFFTPKKMGAQTAEANINAGVAAVKQIVRFFNDGDDTFKVNQ